MTSSSPWTAGVAYGALGFPLAFVALPMMVQWPAHAASQWGLSLAGLGLLLLAVRVADALIDPWIGRRADVWFTASPRAPLRVVAVAGMLLLIGFLALFFRPESVAGRAAVDEGVPGRAAWIWAMGALLLTSLGYSLAQVTHTAWAARLGGSAVQRARWVAYREGFALVGVIAASVLPTLAGWRVTAVVLAVGLLLGWLALRRAPSPSGVDAATASPAATIAVQASAVVAGAARVGEPASSPWRYAGFRRLLVVYLLNGLAAAIPSALVLFFVRDRLQAPPAFEAASLAAYFCCAAAGVPLWMRAVRRWGLVGAWGLGMLLSIVAFVGAAGLGAGQWALFLAVCMASGFALGADLVVPPALLAGVVQSEGLHGRAEGHWFGWWTMATKLNLALAAGVALPLVQWLGYTPGTREPEALQALAIAYALLPCVIKAAAGVALWRWRAQWQEAPAEMPAGAGAAQPGVHPTAHSTAHATPNPAAHPASLARASLAASSATPAPAPRLGEGS